MNDRDTVEVELTARERELILKYGYPFDRIKQVVQSYSDSREEEVLELDRFEVEQLLGDLAISINHDTEGELQEELYDLSEHLERTFRAS